MKAKNFLYGAIGTAVMLAALPVASFAADSVTVTAPKAGATQLQAGYTNGKITDNYLISVNGKIVSQGNLKEIGDKTVQLTLGNTTLASGDEIILYVTGANGQYISQKTTVAKAAPTAKAPTTMTVAPTNITPAENASVVVTFDADYVPHAADVLQVTSYNAAGTAVDSSFEALPDTNNGPVTVTLKNSTQVAAYTIQFVAGDGSATNITPVRVTVGQANNNSGNTNNNGNTPNTNNGSSTPQNNTMTAEQKAAVEAAKDMTFAYPSNTVSPGESVSPTITLIDAAGKKTVYTGPARFSYSGNAVVDGTFDNQGRFSVSSDTQFVGSKIQVTAMLGNFAKTVELTVQATDKALLLGNTEGAVGKNNSVTYQIANGQKTKLRMLWQPTMARVVVKPLDNNKANIVGTVTDMNNVTSSGSGTMILTSDVATRAEVYIVFRDGEGRLFETAHTTYNFTTKAAKKKTVQLFIGNITYTIDKVEKKSDTAPIVLNNRTFVPFRLVAESYGAEVLWNEKEQTVTTKHNGHTIVMKNGSKSYTIDGKQGTMDVAPFINRDNRTMVPLRFLAEGIGCSVTPNYSKDGTTESVTFEG